MQLSKLAYKQFVNDPREWTLEPVEFQQINLIVGRNASGKSRALNIINALAGLISRRNQQVLSSGEFDVTFRDGSLEWKYFLQMQDKLVTLERLTKGSEVLLQRDKDGIGEIFAEQEKRKTKFQSPQTAIAVFSRQDSLQHSFLSQIVEWANGTFHYPFGKELGQNMLSAASPTAPPPNFYDANQTTGVFLACRREFGDPYTNSIIADLREVGYEISDVGLMTPTSIEVTSPVPLNFQCLFVKETALKSPTDQMDMSQGMFRALSILIHLNYGLLSGKSGCIIIDDIGEGLDFSRSTGLIKLIVAKIEATKLQLVMASNDRFVMNSVPLRYWSVFDREGSTVHVYNEKNSRQKFEDFKFTGLSNFDFFATDFLQTEETL